jgi:hypothetical protein
MLNNDNNIYVMYTWKEKANDEGQLGQFYIKWVIAFVLLLRIFSG